MIKRIFILLVVCSILLSVINTSALAVSADDSNNWINLFDYNNVDRTFAVSGNSTSSKTFRLDGISRIFYLDIVVYIGADRGNLDMFVANSNGTIVTQLSGVRIRPNYYRFYGYLVANSYHKFSLVFSNKSNSSNNGTIISARANVSGDSSSACCISYEYYEDEYMVTSGKMPNSMRPVSIYFDDIYPHQFRLELFTDRYLLYDYIDFVISSYGVSIDSISCIASDEFIPVEFSYLSSFESDDGYTYSIYRMDLTNFNRSLDRIPKLVISGLTSVNTTYGFIMDSVRGYAISDFPNPDVYWYREIYYIIDSWASSIYCITEEFYFKFLEIFPAIDSIIETIILEFNSYKDSITNFLSEKFDFIGSKLDELINGTQEQQQEAEEYKENASAQAGQINSAVNNMQVSKPSGNDTNVSIDNITGGLNFGLFNTAVLTLTGQGLVAQILLIAVTLMLVGYVFFGKRG